MKLTAKYNLTLICLLVMGILLSGCSEEDVVPVSSKTVKVGIVGPLSGPDNEWGVNGLLGAEAARAIATNRSRQ